MSIDGWMDKEDVAYIYIYIYIYIYTHTHNGISLGDQKEWNLAICNKVDRTRVYYAKWNQSVRERQIYYFTHMWNLRKKKYEHRVREAKIR